MPDDNKSNNEKAFADDRRKERAVDNDQDKLRRTREQIENELVVAVSDAEERVRRQCTGEGRELAQQTYMEAVKRLNDFVLRGKLPDEVDE